MQNKDFVRAQEIKVQMEELDDEYNTLQEELTEAAAMAAKPPRMSDVSEAPQSAGEDASEDGGGVREDSAVKDDPVVVHKCLAMLYQLLQDPAIKTLNATLQTVLDELVMPSIRDLDAEIRMEAVRTMGVFSLRSIDVAKQNLLLLFQVAEESNLFIKSDIFAANWHLIFTDRSPGSKECSPGGTCHGERPAPLVRTGSVHHPGQRGERERREEREHRRWKRRRNIQHREPP